MTRCLALLALPACLTACSSALPEPPTTAAPLPRAEAPKVGSVLPEWPSIEDAAGPGVGEYRIAAGDVLDIMVVGHDDLRKELPVRPDGRISFRLVGDVEAGGASPEELRGRLELALGRYLRYPQVDVVVKKARESRFTILGEVVRPGVYPINGSTTLLDAVAMGQGLSAGQYEGSTIEIADLTNAFLVRRGKVVPVDFQLAVQRGDTRHNVALEDGDYIYIPSSLAQEVFVLGEVYDPRAYGFRGRVTLLQAVAESGGFRSTARLGDVVILRGLSDGQRQLLAVDVRRLVAGQAPDVELQVGDVVYVPRSRLANVADAMRDILSLLLVTQSVQSL